MSSTPTPALLFTFALAIETGDGDAALATAETHGFGDRPATLLLGMVKLLGALGTYYGRGVVVSSSTPAATPHEQLTDDVIEAVLSGGEDAVAAGAAVIDRAVAAGLFDDDAARGAWLAASCSAVASMLVRMYVGDGLTEHRVEPTPDDASTLTA